MTSAVTIPVRNLPEIIYVPDCDICGKTRCDLAGFG